MWLFTLQKEGGSGRGVCQCFCEVLVEGRFELANEHPAILPIRLQLRLDQHNLTKLLNEKPGDKITVF